MSSLKNGQPDPMGPPAAPAPAPEAQAHAAHRAPAAPAGKNGKEDGPGEISAILQAVRRRWLPALILGTIAGAAAAAAGWSFVPARFTAKSLLRVEATRPSILFTDR